MSKKYIVWLPNNEGDFVWADEVQEKDDAVLFIKNGEIEKSYQRKDIEGYSEVTNTK